MSDYSRNVLTLISGTVLAQAIPVAITPILTRLYTPKDFGVLALYISIVSILGFIANARYELAVMLPDTDEDAYNVMAIGLGIATVFSFMLFIIISLYNQQITQLLGNPDIGSWLYLVPISVFLTGVYNMLSYYCNRKKKYKVIAQAGIVKSLSGSGVQLIGGFASAGVSGLIFGQVVSTGASNFKLFRTLFSASEWVTYVNWLKIKSVASRYSNYPKYSLLGGLINTLSLNMLNVIMSKIYTVTMLGYYSLVQRILGIPSVFIGNSIGQVFFQKANEERRKTGTAIKTFDKTIKQLVLIATPIYLFLYFIVEPLFIIIFGEKWLIAGVYAKIFIPLFAIRFIVSPLANITTVFEKERFFMFWQLLLFLFGVISVGIAYINKMPFALFAQAYVFTISFCYVILAIILRQISKEQAKLFSKIK